MTQQKAAKIVDGVVTQVIVGTVEWDEGRLGGEWLDVTDKQVSRNFTYDGSRFIPPQPYPSWVFDETLGKWTAPVPHPAGDGNYIWDEDSLSWVVYQITKQREV